MDPFQLMEQQKEQFKPNDKKIYHAILEHPEQVIYLSTNKLAENFGVSQPALTRFIKVLGYSRYQDFRSDITASLAKTNISTTPSRLPYFEKLELLLQETEKVLTDQYMKEITDYVVSFPRIFATGIGKSLQPATLMQNLLRKSNILIHVCPLDSLTEYADQMDENDLLIVFSVSAQPEIMDKATLTQGKVFLVTTNSTHKYSKKVDRTLLLPYIPPNPETCPVSPVMFDIFVELLDFYISRL